ncbi:cilia- and flagella-associated protein 184-like [Eurosta solidaginis]|uniref:cilia- and flagella-associated protein 184-like n=1 Tax=Eurosta solidaginis TaxID=178769 RepID=UPI00353068D0
MEESGPTITNRKDGEYEDNEKEVKIEDGIEQGFEEKNEGKNQTSAQNSYIEQDNTDAAINIQLSKVNRKSGIAKTLSQSSIRLKVESEIELRTKSIEVPDEELMTSDSEKSIAMNMGYLNQEPLRISEDFFEKLGQLPTLSIVEDTEDRYSIRSTARKRVSKYSEGADVGSFRNPLTGSIIRSEEESLEVEEEVEEEEEEPAHLSSSSDILISEDDELLELIKSEHEEMEQPKQLDDTQVVETFMEMEKEHVIEGVIEFDWVAYQRELEIQKITTDAREFLTDLIEKAVDKSEYIHPNDLLREKLDKETLIDEISSKLQELEAQQRKRLFLNRRVCDYFYRKGQYRVFAEDLSSESLKFAVDRYKEVTMRLDQMLAREEEVKMNAEAQIEQLTYRKSILKIKNKEKLEELEQLVRKTFAYHGEHLSTVANSLLRSMSKLREEVSAVRYALIKNQHTNATLMEQLKNLEDLGNNLHLRDYENLQTEVQALDKKIEERNVDLKKSRTRCNSKVHIMGHLKEKQAMLRNKVQIQRLFLSDLLEQKQIARESVFKAKTARKKIREDIKELSFQCGLLDKPALMLDYDVTVNEVKKATVRVEALRHKHDDILRKIEKLEGKCL